MNKLEQQMFNLLEQVDKYNHMLPSDKLSIAMQLSKIALELAEKAWKDGSESPDDKVGGELRWNFESFKKEIL